MSRSWFLPSFLDQAVVTMKDHGVRHAFYAFHQGPPSKQLLKADSTPWRLNPIFIDRLAISTDPKRPAANTHFAKSFLKENPSTR
jgi:hypothetical protein